VVWKSRKANRKRLSAARYRTEIIADVLVPDRAEPVRFFSRKLLSPGKLRSFSNRDFRECLALGFYLGVAMLLPVLWWAPICGWASRLRLKRHRHKGFPRYAAATQAVLGDSIDAKKLFGDLHAARHRQRLLLVAHLVGNRWSPALQLEGLDGLQAALLHGWGAIIWCDQFTAQTIMGKRALHEASIEAHQISVNFHGISDTKFGLRFLNRLLIRIENRFLKSRVLFDPSETYQVTIRIGKILRENGVVLMTNTIHAGSTFAESALGESGWTQLASAPVNFAARSRTALFSMSTFETVPMCEYRAVISPELVPEAAKPASGAPGTGEIAPRNMAPRNMAPKNMELQAHYILLKRDRLLEALKLYPEQMMVWASHERLTGQSDSASVDNDAGS
jgi:hypothetical protein